MLPMTGFEPRTSDAKAITLPTEPQPLPKKLSRNGYFELKFYLVSFKVSKCFKLHDNVLRNLWRRQ